MAWRSHLSRDNCREEMNKVRDALAELTEDELSVLLGEMDEFLKTFRRRRGN